MQLFEHFFSELHFGFVANLLLRFQKGPEGCSSWKYTVCKLRKLDVACAMEEALLSTPSPKTKRGHRTTTSINGIFKICTVFAILQIMVIINFFFFVQSSGMLHFIKFISLDCRACWASVRMGMELIMSPDQIQGMSSCLRAFLFTNAILQIQQYPFVNTGIMSE